MSLIIKRASRPENSTPSSMASAGARGVAPTELAAFDSLATIVA